MSAGTEIGSRTQEGTSSSPDNQVTMGQRRASKTGKQPWGQCSWASFSEGETRERERNQAEVEEGGGTGKEVLLLLF